MARAPIGLRVRERRKELGQTQVALAERLGVSPSYLNLIENGKRPIGGRLLNRIADELEVDLEALDAAADRRLIDDLVEIAGASVLRELSIAPQSAADFVGRHSPWARAVAALHSAYVERDRTAALLADRLSQDPFLSDAVHRMVSNAAAIRSTAELLNTVDDLDANEMQRFHGILGLESARLAEVCRAIVGFFDESDAVAGQRSPMEEVDFLLYERRNYFPELEAAAERLSAEAKVDAERWGARWLDHLAERFGVSFERVAGDHPSIRGASGPARYDPNAKRFVILDSAPTATRRFEIAKLVARLALSHEIEAELARADRLSSEQARDLARNALAAYAAGALTMPYDAFYQEARRARFDIDALARRFTASFEQVAHRFVTLRRSDAAGPPFAFVRSDPSGFVTKRFPLPNLPMPRQSGACPLWAVYQAFQTPDAIARQLVEFPNGDQFLFIARAVAKEGAPYGQPRRLMSVMLACDAMNADQLVYGDGLAIGPRSAPILVGQSCRLCVRGGCGHRQDASIMSTPPAHLQ